MASAKSQFPLERVCGVYNGKWKNAVYSKPKFGDERTVSKAEERHKDERATV